VSRVTFIPSDRRLQIVVLAVAVGVAAALTVASASLALKSQKRNTLAARQAAIVPLPRLAVFNRAQTAAERAAPASNPDVRAILDSLPATDPSTLRFALVGVGPDKRSAFVVRGRDGRTCSGLTGFTSGCLDGLPSDMPAEITYGGETATAGPVVWGVVRNDVRAIDVVVDGQASPALLGHNAYFFQAPAGKTSQDLQVLRVHMADGTVTTEPIG
jgi:hypothetical protein